MTRIVRQPEAFADESYDMVVIGGGVYGATLVYEAARRGLRPLLVEQDDFGSGVSGNSLRIVHGGLRYLQDMDLRRHRESVAERRWHLRQFPGLVRPLTCLMPLYGKGLKRPSTFRVALAMNDLLSADRNRGVQADRRLPAGTIIGVDEVGKRFPLAIKEGLRGAGVWHDAVMLSSERVLMQTLRIAAANGARMLNYTKAIALEQVGGRVTGVRVLDRVSGHELVYRTNRVINCAGPWCRALAASFDRDEPSLFRPSLAFNLLLDRPAVSEYAVAIEPPTPGAKACFVVPWKGKVLAGTRHIPWGGGAGAPTPPEAEVAAFINELNAAMPGFDADRSEVRRVYAGLLPATRDGWADTTHTPVLHDHGRHGGPAGLLSVSGVKWTTARGVAERTLKLALDRLPAVKQDVEYPAAFEPARLTDTQAIADDPEQFGALCDRLIVDESVVHLDDLLLRRMDGLDNDVAMSHAVRAGTRAMRKAGMTPDMQRLIHALDARQDRAAIALRNCTHNTTASQDTDSETMITKRPTGTA